MNLIDKLNEAEIHRVMEGKTIPEFATGDTIIVKVKLDDERTQNYEGVCIGRKNRGINSSFIVRKLSHGEGVERTFPLYSPNIAQISVLRRGAVRRAKLYYLRDREGKAARIREENTGYKAKLSKKA